MSAEEASYVPTEEILVVQYEKRIVENTKNPHAKGWIVKHKADPNKPFRLWLRPGVHYKMRQLYSKFPKPRGKGGFLKGRAIRNYATPIHTCGTNKDGLQIDRPQILFRVTHDGQPHSGKKPRAHGLVTVTPLYFHIFVLKHLIWPCRSPSPFLSATNSIGKKDHVVNLYRERGYQNIKLITFRTYGPGWDHQKQRMYHVPTLCKELDCRSLRYIEHMDCEYIIEGEIPEESIISEEYLESGDLPCPEKKPKPRTGVSKPSTDLDDEGGVRKRTTAYQPCT
ncbi:hypothetical protein F4801DRAFT_574294 [Xylaria longipes]|nr:hypothetical protein F4801DRAFT_574294 [Xylaria longipes]